MMTRLNKIRNILSEHQLDGIIVSTTANITYLTGFEFLVAQDREAFIVVTKNKQYIISSQLYRTEFEKIAPEYIFLEISSATRKSFSDHIADIVNNEKVTNLGFEEDNITYREYSLIAKKSNTQTHPLSLDDIRSQKDAGEISYIEKACTLGDEAFTYILTKVTEGISEKKLAFYLENFIRENGADISFPTIVAFGKNAAVPHHATDETMLKKNQFVLFDFGVKQSHYCSDMTRTIFFGKPSKTDKKLYQTVYEAQQKALKYLQNNKAPFNAVEVDAKARNHVTQEGFPQFPHSLGHSIGILVHDGFRLSPFSKTKLQEGYVFSVEPGIYLNGVAGVRIEDIVAIEAKGPRLLTQAPRELIVL